MRCGQEWKWLVDVDVVGYFDNIDHSILINSLLEKRIHDSRFIGLIRGMLKAGYMEDWVYHRTYGTPQGDRLSPILANIPHMNSAVHGIESQPTIGAGNVHRSKADGS